MSRPTHNMEDKRRVQLGDLINLEGLEKLEGREVLAEIPAVGVAKLSSLAAEIEDNKEVKLSEVKDVVEDLQSALVLLRFRRINYFGDVLTAEQYRAIGNLTENTEICRQLANTVDEKLGKQIETPRLKYLPHGLVAAARKFAGTSHLSLNGLKNIDLELAQELGDHHHGLSLSGLSEITPEIARALTAENRDILVLNGLRRLSKEAAEELVKYKGERLFLDGLSPTIDVEMAKILSRYPAMLHLDGLTEISLEVAKEFGSGAMKGLALSGVKEISAEAIREVLKGKTELELNGLEDISDEVALELAKYQGWYDATPQVQYKIRRFKEALKQKDSGRE